MRNLALFLLISIAFLFSNCQPKAEEQKDAQESYTDELGEVSLPVTGDAAAIPHFEDGLLLMHNFEYVDARAAFDKAIEKDPDFLMAHWGKAMSYNQPIWHRQSYEDGQAALEKIAATEEERLAKAPTDLERDLLKAAEILYGEGEKLERDQQYSAYLSVLYEKYPNNHEVAAFYALSLLGSVPYGRDDKVYEKGAAIANGILKENPNHPGALHYLIHSYDDPYHAHLAKMAADSYAKVAPDAAHALHMPSHIYVALGLWDEVVRSNIASWEASVNRMKRLNKSIDAQSYHAFHWLMYGRLQQGQFEEAERLLQEMEGYMDESPSKSARSYMVRMKANYLTETEDWGHLAADIAVEVEDLNITHRTAHAFVSAMKAYANGDTATLRTIILAMDEDRQLAQLNVSDRGVPMCGAVGWSTNDNNQLEIDQAKVMSLQLRGLYAKLKNDPEKTQLWLSEAVDLEDRLAYSYGPPEIPKPSFELYGEWLLEQGDLEGAKAQFEKAIKRGPQRILALRGQWQTAQKMGDMETTKELEQQLKDLLKKADAEAFDLPFGNQTLSLK